MNNSYLQLIRLKQWIKNFVILFPVFFAGNKSELSIYISLAKAFVAFSLITSAVYILNDIIDKEDDINHPIKKYRPIASKQIKVIVALFIGIFCGLFGLAYFFFFEPSALVPTSIYIIMMIFYCLFFRKIAILDVLIISVGFVLRLFIGGELAGTPI